MFGTGNIVDEALSGVARGSGSFFGSLVSAPFNVIASFARGAVGSIWTMVAATAAFAGVKIFAPEIWGAGLHAIGGKKLADESARVVKEDGIPGILRDSAKLGILAGGLWGGGKGMLESLTGNDVRGVSGIGNVIGVMGTVAAVGLLVTGAVSKSGVKAAGDADAASSHTPPTTPAAPKAAAPQLKK